MCVGDTVSEGQNIAEAATDKISIFIEAPASGIITQLFVEDDDTVFIGDVIAEISKEK